LGTRIAGQSRRFDRIVVIDAPQRILGCAHRGTQAAVDIGGGEVPLLGEPIEIDHTRVHLLLGFVRARERPAGQCRDAAVPAVGDKLVQAVATDESGAAEQQSGSRHP
jgi:hypothetical protein